MKVRKAGAFVDLAPASTSLVAHGNTGASEAFDPAAGLVHTATLDSAVVAITLTNPSGSIGEIELILTQDATGGRTVTWPTNIKWPFKALPTLSPGAGRGDHFRFVTLDGGTTWVADILAQGLAIQLPAPSIRAIGSAYATNSGPASAPIPKPAGTQAGDLVLVFYENTGSAAAPGAPAGWTNFYTSDNGNQRYRGWYKIMADQAEADVATVDITGGNGNVRAFAVSVANPDPANVIDVITAVGQDSAANPAVPGLDPNTTRGISFLMIHGMQNPNYPFGVTPPAGYTEAIEFGSVSTQYVTQELSYKVLTNGDPTGNLVPTITDVGWGSSWNYRYVHFIIGGGGGAPDAGSPVNQAALDAVVSTLAAVSGNTQTASYQLVLADAGKVVEMDVATANNLTIPTDATVNFPIGTVIELWQKGAGQTTIVPAGGVTLRSPGGLTKLYGQYSGGSIRKRAANEWVLQGDLA